MNRLRRTILFLALSLSGSALLVHAAVAQDLQRARASQRGTVSQAVHTTIFTVTYDRPVARGRTLFGAADPALVKYGKEWTPGANRATVLEITGDVLVEGEPLDAAKYSVWAVPGVDEWTIIFSRAWDVFHIPYPEGEDVLRVVVQPERGQHMETLAWYFPVVGPDSTVLNIHWGEVVVPLRFRLRSSPPSASHTTAARPERRP